MPIGEGVVVTAKHRTRHDTRPTDVFVGLGDPVDDAVQDDRIAHLGNPIGDDIADAVLVVSEQHHDVTR